MYSYQLAILGLGLALTSGTALALPHLDELDELPPDFDLEAGDPAELEF